MLTSFMEIPDLKWHKYIPALGKDSNKKQAINFFTYLHLYVTTAWKEVK